MKKFLIIVLVVIITMPYISYSQPYKAVIVPDVSLWYFAHSQMAGSFIDTIFAGQKNDSLIEIWYKGEFYNWEKTLAGTIRSSDNADKLWFTASDETTEHLIYDISLEKGDKFDSLVSSQSDYVDTVYYIEGNKIVEFNTYTAWNEPIRFIEGVGPNTSLIWAWKDPGFLSTFLVCSFENDIKVFETSNEGFIDCNFNTISVDEHSIPNFRIYPNPFIDQFQIIFEGNNLQEKVNISIISITGEEIYREVIFNQGEHYISTENIPSGFFVLTINNSYEYGIFKLIKL